MLLLINNQGRLHRLDLSHRDISKMPKKVRIKLIDVYPILVKRMLPDYLRT